MEVKDLLKKKNVVVVGKGKKTIGGVKTDRNAIVVGVIRKITPWQMAMDELGMNNLVPLTIKIKGVEIETDVIEVGEIKALDIDRKSKVRPAPGGVSIGHPSVTAGTLGMVVKKKGIRHILSNYHVLAGSNEAQLGDQTWQPGKADNGTAADTIGHLVQFVKIQFTGESSCPVATTIAAALNFFAKVFGRATRLYPISEVTNKVDCAIARPIIDSNVSDEILEIGTPTGFSEAEINDKIKKSGRTTELNHGQVIAIDGLAKVSYGGSKIATFEDQILTSPIAEGGDSGSVVLNDNKEVIGLLFAGSAQMSIVNKIQNVIAALKLDG